VNRRGVGGLGLVALGLLLIGAVNTDSVQVFTGQVVIGPDQTPRGPLYVNSPGMTVVGIGGTQGASVWFNAPGGGGAIVARPDGSMELWNNGRLVLLVRGQDVTINGNLIVTGNTTFRGPTTGIKYNAP
jgi:hypothetical protein